MDHYDRQIQRVGAQKMLQAVAAVKAGDVVALAKVGLAHTSKWDRAALSFRARVLVSRQAQHDEANQRTLRRGR